MAALAKLQVEMTVKKRFRTECANPSFSLLLLIVSSVFHQAAATVQSNSNYLVTRRSSGGPTRGDRLEIMRVRLSSLLPSQMVLPHVKDLESSLDDELKRIEDSPQGNDIDMIDDLAQQESPSNSKPEQYEALDFDSFTPLLEPPQQGEDLLLNLDIADLVQNDIEILLSTYDIDNTALNSPELLNGIDGQDEGALTSLLPPSNGSSDGIFKVPPPPPPYRKTKLGSIVTAIKAAEIPIEETSNRDIVVLAEPSSAENKVVAKAKAPTRRRRRKPRFVAAPSDGDRNVVSVALEQAPISSGAGGVVRGISSGGKYLSLTTGNGFNGDNLPQPLQPLPAFRTIQNKPSGTTFITVKDSNGAMGYSIDTSRSGGLSRSPSPPLYAYSADSADPNSLSPQSFVALQQTPNIVPNVPQMSPALRYTYPGIGNQNLLRSTLLSPYRVDGMNSPPPQGFAAVQQTPNTIFNRPRPHSLLAIEGPERPSSPQYPHTVDAKNPKPKQNYNRVVNSPQMSPSFPAGIQDLLRSSPTLYQYNGVTMKNSQPQGFVRQSQNTMPNGPQRSLPPSSLFEIPGGLKSPSPLYPYNANAINSPPQRNQNQKVPKSPKALSNGHQISPGMRRSPPPLYPYNADATNSPSQNKVPTSPRMQRGLRSPPALYPYNTGMKNSPPQGFAAVPKTITGLNGPQMQPYSLYTHPGNSGSGNPIRPTSMLFPYNTNRNNFPAHGFPLPNIVSNGPLVSPPSQQSMGQSIKRITNQQVNEPLQHSKSLYTKDWEPQPQPQPSPIQRAEELIAARELYSQRTAPMGNPQPVFGQMTQSAVSSQSSLTPNTVGHSTFSFSPPSQLTNYRHQSSPVRNLSPTKVANPGNLNEQGKLFFVQPEYADPRFNSPNQNNGIQPGLSSAHQGFGRPQIQPKWNQPDQGQQVFSQFAPFQPQQAIIRPQPQTWPYYVPPERRIFQGSPPHIDVDKNRENGSQPNQRQQTYSLRNKPGQFRRILPADARVQTPLQDPRFEGFSQQSPMQQSLQFSAKEIPRYSQIRPITQISQAAPFSPMYSQAVGPQGNFQRAPYDFKGQSQQTISQSQPWFNARAPGGTCSQAQTQKYTPQGFGFRPYTNDGKVGPHKETSIQRTAPYTIPAYNTGQFQPQGSSQYPEPFRQPSYLSSPTVNAVPGANTATDRFTPPSVGSPSGGIKSFGTTWNQFSTVQPVANHNSGPSNNNNVGQPRSDVRSNEIPAGISPTLTDIEKVEKSAHISATQPKTAILPQHRGEMPFYSQSQLDSHHRRLLGHQETKEDNEFNNGPALLQYYILGAQQVLRPQISTDNDTIAKSDAGISKTNTSLSTPNSTATSTSTEYAAAANVYQPVSTVPAPRNATSNSTVGTGEPGQTAAVETGTTITTTNASTNSSDGVRNSPDTIPTPLSIQPTVSNTHKGETGEPMAEQTRKLRSASLDEEYDFLRDTEDLSN